MRLRPQTKPFQMSLGSRGEIIAWNYLRKKGYKILEKNFRCAIGEIDIVAENKKRIVFVEVKTRTSDRFGIPEESVSTLKQQKLVRLAQWYLKDKKWTDRPVSFEVLAVDWNGGEPEIRHIENAFGVASD